MEAVSILVSVWALMGGSDGDNGMIPIRVMGVPSDSDLVVMVLETMFVPVLISVAA